MDLVQKKENQTKNYYLNYYSENLNPDLMIVDETIIHIFTSLFLLMENHIFQIFCQRHFNIIHGTKNV